MTHLLHVTTVSIFAKKKRCVHREPAKTLRVLSVNCNSIHSANKRAEVSIIIDHHSPQIILGQESKLGTEHHTSDIVRDNYHVFRKDRKSCGAGVFMLLREYIEYNENACEDCETDCEIVGANQTIWLKITQHCTNV